MGKNKQRRKAAVIQSYLNIDCMDEAVGLPSFPDNHFDLAIVDPPYGGNDAIGLKDNSSGKKQATKRTEYKIFENVAPSKEYFKELFRVSKDQIIWGVNFYNNYDLSGGRICWDKKGTAFGRAEIAYYSGSKSVNICELTWNGMLQSNMKNKESRIHPTQKPVALYRWLLNTYAKPGDLILDTHVGSASSLIAFEEQGFKYVGFELDEDYYRESKKRLEQARKQQSLFSPAEIRDTMKQGNLFENNV